MKKLLSIMVDNTLTCGASKAQEKRMPEKEIKAQGEHVKSSGNDLLHLHFKKAHQKHVAEARRRNRGIDKDLRGVGAPPPPPPAPKKVVIH